MKDNFSSVAKNYKLFRPEYPTALYDFLYRQLKSFDHAWDVGTGNGQVARVLAQKFEQVLATDISEQQLREAPEYPNVRYQKQSAEEPFISHRSFDLIIVAQAIHWFDFDLFYNNVKNYLHPEGLFAAVGYGLLGINEETDSIIRHFYEHTLAGFWDPERRYIDENYQTIPFPFRELESPKLESTYEANLDWLCGYLSTWSAVNHYKKERNEDPIPGLRGILEEVLPLEGTFPVRFPVLLRAGRLLL